MLEMEVEMKMEKLGKGDDRDESVGGKEWQ